MERNGIRCQAMTDNEMAYFRLTLDIRKLENNRTLNPFMRQLQIKSRRATLALMESAYPGIADSVLEKMDHLCAFLIAENDVSAGMR